MILAVHVEGVEHLVREDRAVASVRRHREFALGLGARAYLVKPVSLVRLLDTAASLLEHG